MKPDRWTSFFVLGEQKTRGLKVSCVGFGKRICFCGVGVTVLGGSRSIKHGLLQLRLVPAFSYF